MSDMNEIVIDSVLHSVPNTAQNADVASLTTNMIDEFQQRISEMQGQIDCLRLWLWFLTFVIIGLVVGLVLYKKKLKRYQTQRDEEQDDKLLVLEKKFGQLLQKATGDMRSKIDQLETQTTNINASIKEVNTRVAQSKNEPKAEKGGIDTNHRDVNVSANKTTTQDVVKYFTPQEVDGQLIVRERNLKDDNSRGWFKIVIKGEQAIYDINPNAVSALLSDQMTLSLCTKKFEPNPKATRIRTEHPGKLYKEGSIWVISEKISIELL